MPIYRVTLVAEGRRVVYDVVANSRARAVNRSLAIDYYVEQAIKYSRPYTFRCVMIDTWEHDTHPLGHRLIKLVATYNISEDVNAGAVADDRQGQSETTTLRGMWPPITRDHLPTAGESEVPSARRESHWEDLRQHVLRALRKHGGAWRANCPA